MNQEQVTAFIINELTRHRDRNDIILDLCRQLNIEWKKAFNRKKHGAGIGVFLKKKG